VIPCITQTKAEARAELETLPGVTPEWIVNRADPAAPRLLGIYFYDPNGIRLEFACQPEDGETPAVIPCITQTKAEARAELETLPSVTPEWIEKRLAALPG
jgi:hypothetical protein